MASDLMAELRLVTVPTPLGLLSVVSSPDGVIETAFEGEHGPDVARLEGRLGTSVRVTRGRDPIRDEVAAYFSGRLHAFSTPPDLSRIAPGFARRVLQVTATIPFGELWTYGDVAGMAGSPRGGRAAGNALSHCPIELFVPCHRVVHAGGTIGGYGRHDDRKRFLIQHELTAVGGEPDGRRPRTRG